MHFSTALTLSLPALAAAVDMTPYVASTGVEAGFAPFIEEYYRINEDPLANATFLDLWTPTDSVMILQGTNVFEGPAAMLAVRNRLLPATGTPSKAWWHVIQSAEVVGEDDASKTYRANMIVQTTYVPGNCSQAHGTPEFTVLKDGAGLPILTPHAQNLKVYNLTMNTVATPTDEACTTA